MLGRRSLGGAVVEGLAPGRDNAGSSSNKRKLEQDESDQDSSKKPKLDNSDQVEPEQDQKDNSDQAEPEQPSPDQSDGENSKKGSSTDSYERYEREAVTDTYESSLDSYDKEAVTDPYVPSPPPIIERDPPSNEPWPPEMARRSGPTMPYSDRANIPGPSPPVATYSNSTPSDDSLPEGEGISRSDADSFIMD